MQRLSPSHKINVAPRPERVVETSALDAGYVQLSRRLSVCPATDANMAFEASDSYSSAELIVRKRDLADRTAMNTAILEYLGSSRDVVEAAMEDRTFIQAVTDITTVIAEALAADRKLLTCGNGGSAGDAQHIAGEFVSRLNYDRAPAAAIALTTDGSVLTAIGNDYGYERIFERQVLALGRSGDVLLAISTSGRSPSILAAMRAARTKGLAVVGFGGVDGGDMPPLADLMLKVPSQSTPLIQQMHITAAHIVCGLVEERLFPRS